MEDICIHEFAHSIHLIGILSVYPDFNDRLEKLMDAALVAGKWKNMYTATNLCRRRAGLVRCQRRSVAADRKHNQVNTRKELKQYDRGLYDINLFEGEKYDKKDVRYEYHRTKNIFRKILFCMWRLKGGDTVKLRS